MDFTFGEAEVEASGLAAQVLGAAKAGSASDAGAAADAGQAADLDCSLWKELGQAGLLSLALPAELGGDGLGVQATAAVLTEVGRYAARIPALATLALGVLPVARSRNADLKRKLLAGVAAGETFLTAAIREPSHPMPSAPATIATLAGKTGTVSGVKVGVPYAAAANWILVPASTSTGDAIVAIVELGVDGLTCQRTLSSSGLPEYTVRLADSPILQVLDGCSVGDLYELAAAGTCAVGDGVLAAALDLTTEYIRRREHRPAAGDVPGRGPADRRRLRRRAHAAPGYLVGVLAARRGPGGWAGR